MPKRLLLIITTMFVLLVPLHPAQAAETDDETQFVVLINDLRSSLGLPSVEVHADLVGPARSWADHLAVDGELSHAGDLSIGVTSDWTKLGENVGVASEGQIQQLFEAFVASPGHYENLVDPSFRHVGIGVVYDEQGRIWTTHRFMALSVESPDTASPPTTATPASPSTAPASSAGVSEPEAPPPEQLAFTDGATIRLDAVAMVIDGLVGSGV